MKIKHECGVALVRLLKPLQYYQEHYGTWAKGLDELYLLMEKQHNRGQEGAGAACVKMHAQPGDDYMFRQRALGTGAIGEVFANIHQQMKEAPAECRQDSQYALEHFDFAGELYMGHLRYSTTGRSGLRYVHPFLRRNNWRARNLCICGNFNMTNVEEIFDSIVQNGQHPRAYTDTYILLELLGHRLDMESQRLYDHGLAQGLSGQELTDYIEHNIDMARVLRTASQQWDGGFVICGVTGSGEMFALRDPWGIRTAFYYADDEQVVLASERPVIQTTLFCAQDEVVELNPGQALIVNARGQMRLEQILLPQVKQACSFERIYFSRGSDADIYRERKALGRQLVEPILQAVDHDLQHTVFSYIPNTAEAAYYGMLEGLDDYLNQSKVKAIQQLGANATPDDVQRMFSQRILSEKVAWKDIKLRTFIAEGATKNELAAHVYDITYGSLTPYVDNLVIIDDSIVRGTTLRESIIRILDRLHPKRIVIVSSSPQVRYPDYYGIDMSHMDEFIAFRAAIQLLQDTNQQHIITKVRDLCLAQKDLPKEQMTNHVRLIYEPFTQQQISDKMAQMLRDPSVKAEVTIVYQTLEGLTQASPNHTGQWYFNGHYPTPGGVMRLNEAFLQWTEKSGVCTPVK